ATAPITYGRIHAMFLANLLGHFPTWQTIVAPIETYQAGDLDRCRANFYLGTYFDNQLPAAFLADYATTSAAVVWAGYNAWMLPGDSLASECSVRFRQLARIDDGMLDAKGEPTFFRYFEYRGEEFKKYGLFTAEVPRRFVADGEILTYDFSPGNVAP